MSKDEVQPSIKPQERIAFRIAVCALVLFFGILIMIILIKLKKPPAEAHNGEKSLRVRVVEAKPIDQQVTIIGYGQVKTVNSVSLAAELAGKVIKIHPHLETGAIIPQGEMLLEIDPANYQAALTEAQATVDQLNAGLESLKKQFDLDRKRLVTLKRNQELQEIEYQRIKNLFEKNRVGTRASIDRAEQSYNQTSDIYDQIANAVELYPVRIKEAVSRLKAAQARLMLAHTNLERCHLKAPFNARLKSVMVEKEQFVSPGQPLITLADDSILEIQVPLDSQDVRQWLPFEDAPDTAANLNWFASLKPVEGCIKWTEDSGSHNRQAKLDRVIHFDPATRTVTVALRIQNGINQKRSIGRLPITEGMFCSVAIPGRMMRNVFKVPRHAVHFDNTVYKAVSDHLKTAAVTVARFETDFAYISAGVTEGDRIIITRLADPLENSKLMILPNKQKGNSL